MKNILLISAHFPPSAEVGIYRTLSLFKGLFNNGYNPHVLTMRTGAYKNIDNDFIIPNEVCHLVHRAFSLDSKRHLAPYGKHFKVQKIPDEWWPWIIPAVVKGLRIIKKNKIECIWSTYPFMSAHIVGYILSKMTGIKLILDYQDPLEYLYKDSNELNATVNKIIDKRIINHCCGAIFCTKDAASIYARTYPDSSDKFHTIENGYDEEMFSSIDKITPSESKTTFLYSGSLYIPERDPRPIFEAIRILLDDYKLNISYPIIRFRGAGNGTEYESILNELGIRDLVEFLPRITFKQSLVEMLSSKALILIQGKNFNSQIPGKAYEYLKTQKPILALTPPESATGSLMGKFDGVEISCDPHVIASAMNSIMAADGEIQYARDVSAHSRIAVTKKYVKLIENLTN